MTQDEVADIAEAVTKQLMNGPLRTMIREEVDDALSEASTFSGTTARKIDDLHRWQREMNQDMAAIRNEMGI